MQHALELLQQYIAGLKNLSSCMLRVRGGNCRRQLYTACSTAIPQLIGAVIKPSRTISFTFNMAVESPPSLSTIFENLTSSLTLVLSSLPLDRSSLLPSKDGISLLDTKNEIFLSYVQYLVFLIIFKLRDAQKIRGTEGEGPSEEEDGGSTGGQEQEGVTAEAIVKKLVECRVFLERGIKPLEGRLKYQLDKVLRAAEDVERKAVFKGNANDGSGRVQKGNGMDGEGTADVSESLNTSDEDDPDKGTPSLAGLEIDELSYRPHPASLLQPRSTTLSATTKTKVGDGIYRPPRIAPTSLPTTDRGSTAVEGSRGRRRNKSAVVDEYIATELSNAPIAEPSIGSTVVGGGRRNKTARERQAEAERRDYEESNFVRLPKESKKDRAMVTRGHDQRGGYGGEEWRGLGEGVDRIERLTAKRKGSGRAFLERSRKRELDLTKPIQSGQAIATAGERMEKRRRVLGKRNRTKADYQ